MLMSYFHGNGKMLTLRETGWQVYKNSLHFLCNSSVNMKLCQNKVYLEKLVKVIDGNIKKESISKL